MKSLNFSKIRIAFLASFCFLHCLGASVFAASPDRYRVVYEFDGKNREASKTQVEVWFNSKRVLSARAFVGNSFRLIKAQFHQSVDGTFNLTFKGNPKSFKLRSLHLDPTMRVLSASAIYTDTCSLNMRNFKEQRKGQTIYYGKTADYGL